MIHVCFCFTDKTGHYSKFVGTAMLSLFENATAAPRSITIHILHDDTLTADNREKFSYLTARYDQIVKFYNVEKICAENFSKMKKENPKLIKDNRFTIGMMFRLFIPQVVSADIDKVIYLDADIIVNMDLKELWEIELGDKYLAVVTSNSIAMKKHTHYSRYLCVAGFVKPDDYFNSGVLLMNLKVLRGESKRIMDGINFIGSDSRYTHFDQDVLNYCFTKKILKLPVRFNNSVSFARAKKDFTVGQKIYHFLGSNYRSFGLNMRDPFNRLWMSYFIKTPWFDANSIGQIFAGFQNMCREMERYRLNFSALMPGKKRAFFVEDKKVQAVKKIFSISDDKEIFIAETENSVQKLIDTMKKSQDKKIFFIMTKKFPFDKLNKAGLVQGEDFLQGWNFLRESYGEPFDTYPLVQAM